MILERLFESYHSHKKRTDSLEGSLDQVLFAADLEFSKILVPKLPQRISNVNIECARKLKDLCSFCDHFLEELIGLNFIILILMFLIYDTLCKLIIYMVAPLREQLRKCHYTGALHWRKNIVAVILLKTG